MSIESTINDGWDARDSVSPTTDGALAPCGDAGDCRPR
jgi:hypothetical protein